MKERPILFNTEMVRAILDGRKTQTRRVINFGKLSNIKRGRLFYSKTFDSWAIEDKGPSPEADITLVNCPYGKVGDKLWVRETFAVGSVVGAENDEWYLSQCKGENNFIPKEYCIRNDIGVEDVIWKPSIFMPRKASRITLEIQNIRVERLQDITLEDAREEGINPKEIGSDYEGIKAFEKLWNSINESKGKGWNENPWVWVVEFKKVEK